MSKQNHPYRQARFLVSAATFDQLPADEGIEIAFVGRSNVGKSSAINAITDIRGLAYASKTPGRTQLINLFSLDTERRLVDLPGFGYAKVPEEMKMRWQKTLSTYLQKRQSLRGLVLLADIRHPLKEEERAIISWSKQSNLPIFILLTKADKLSRSQLQLALQSFQEILTVQDTNIVAQPFSTLKKLGITETRDQLDKWFSW